MVRLTKQELFTDDVITQHKKGYSVTNIKEITGCNEQMIYSILKNHDLKPNPIHGHLKFNKFQKEFLVGTVLGDAYISPKKSLKIVHSIKQKEYFMFKFNIFKEFFIEPREHAYYDKRFDKTYTTWYSRSHPVEELEEIRNIFYKNNKKVIPIDYLYDTFTSVSLAALFMDDGEVRGRIALMCFNDDDLNAFCKLLFDKFNIVAEINKERCVCIREISRTHFENLIIPYMCESMYYKLKNVTP